ncbi:major facilitator superfamily domain-containing protein [Cokeromyces recurvatus]|uniref:major facilitator superfamily domain-containing protein n=1 Tax=Cokeromyces recurvatus TaxID=90255 RepID=UPI00221FBDBC|nr:major facilitator superfamily domain-containing protein [Cokeromyces recurvatus]KAI7900437.1 major facilitator superfamily domain-containing protein [Cokeromyces recurvatus]
MKLLLDKLRKHSKEDVNDDQSDSGRTTVVDPLEIPLKTYPQAWLALLILVLLRTAISVFQFTFSVVPSLTGELFHVSLTGVNWLANVQGLMYIFMSFFTGWIFQTLGVKRSLILSALLNASGCAIRSIGVKMSPPSFIVIMLGQIVGSASAPLALNIMTTFAATWFTENKRATAGMFVATSVEKVPMIVHLVSGLAAVIVIPVTLMPSKPPSPPSRAMNEESTPSFFKGIRILSKNYNFWILFLVHGMNVGLSIAFGSIFTQIISPHGYTDAQAGQMNAVAFFAGTLGCSVAGPVLDSTKQHRLFLRLIAPMVLVTDIGFIFISNYIYLLVYDIYVKDSTYLLASYPVSDATSNSIIWQGCQIFGFLIVLIMDLLRDTNGTPKNNMYQALLLQAALAGLMMLLSFAFTGRMLRSEAIEKLRKLEQEEEEVVEEEKSIHEKNSGSPPLENTTVIEDEEVRLDTNTNRKSSTIQSL